MEELEQKKADELEPVSDLIGRLRQHTIDCELDEVGANEAKIVSLEDSAGGRDVEQLDVDDDVFGERDKNGDLVYTLDNFAVYDKSGNMVDLTRVLLDSSLGDDVTVFGSVVAPLVYDGMSLVRVPRGTPRLPDHERVIDMIGSQLARLNAAKRTAAAKSSNSIAVPGYDPNMTREEAYCEAKIVTEQNPAPFTVGGITITDLGEIVAESSYHTPKHLFPVGFRSVRQYTSCVDPNNRAEYVSEILEGTNGPIFRVTHEGGSPVFEASTSSAAWLNILREVNTKKVEVGLQPKGTAISGPEMYGFANVRVASVLEGLLGVMDCDSYQFRAQRPGAANRPATSGGSKRKSNGEAPKRAPVLLERGGGRRGMTVKDAASLKSAGKQLIDLQNKEAKEIKDVLRRLEKVTVNFDLLVSTGVGKLVNRLRKHSDKQIVNTAKELKHIWKTIDPESGSSRTTSKAKNTCAEAGVILIGLIGLGDEPVPEGIAKDLGRRAGPRQKLLDILKRLDKIRMVSVDVLVDTGMGKTIGKLRKHVDPEIAASAMQMKAKWQKQIEGPSDFDDEDEEEGNDDSNDEVMEDVEDDGKHAKKKKKKKDKKKKRKRSEEEDDDDETAKKKIKSENGKSSARAIAKLSGVLDEVGVEKIVQTLKERPRARVQINKVKAISMTHAAGDEILWIETENGKRYRLAGPNVPTCAAPGFGKIFAKIYKCFEACRYFINFMENCEDIGNAELDPALKKIDAEANNETVPVRGGSTEKFESSDIVHNFYFVLDQLTRVHKHPKKTNKALTREIVTELARRGSEHMGSGLREYVRSQYNAIQEVLREQSKTEYQRKRDILRKEQQKKKMLEDGVGLPDDLQVIEEDVLHEKDAKITDPILLTLYEKSKTAPERPAPTFLPFDTAFVDIDSLIDFVGPEHDQAVPKLGDFRIKQFGEEGAPSLDVSTGMIFSAMLTVWTGSKLLLEKLDKTFMDQNKVYMKSFATFRIMLARSGINELCAALLRYLSRESKLKEIDGTSGAKLVAVEEAAGISTRRGGGRGGGNIAVRNVASSTETNFPYNEDELWPAPECCIDEITWPEIAKRFLLFHIQTDLDRARFAVEGPVVKSTEKMEAILRVEPDLLSTCDQVLLEVMDNVSAPPFSVPVDPVAHGLPTYLDVINRPMDLGTIQERLRKGHYEPSNAPPNNRYSQVYEWRSGKDKEVDEDAEESEDKTEENKDTEDDTKQMTDVQYQKSMDELFYEFDCLGSGHEGVAADVRQVWRNCRKFHKSSTKLYTDSRKLENLFNKHYDDKVMGRDPKYFVQVEVGEEVDPILKMEEIPTIPKPEDVLILLKQTGDFSLIPLGAKLRVLMCLLDYAMESPSTRDLLSQRTQSILTAHRNYQQICKEDQKKERELGSKKSELLRHQQVMEQHRLEFVEECKQNAIRVDSLGSDRFFNRYWLVDDTSTSSIFVEIHKTGQWGYYARPEEIENLIESLDIRGMRENNLHRNLKHVWETVRTNLSQMHVDAQAKIQEYSKIRTGGIEAARSKEVEIAQAELVEAEAQLAKVAEAASLWLPAKTDEGKVYYYHRKSRESTWDLPPEKKREEEEKENVQHARNKVESAKAGTGDILRELKQRLCDDSVFQIATLSNYPDCNGKLVKDLEAEASTFLQESKTIGLAHRIIRFIATIMTLEASSAGPTASPNLSPKEDTWVQKDEPEREKWLAAVEAIVEKVRQKQLKNLDQTFWESDLLVPLRSVVKTLFKQFVGDPYKASNEKAQLSTIQAARHEFRILRAIDRSSSLAQLGLMVSQIQHILQIPESAKFNRARAGTLKVLLETLN